VLNNFARGLLTVILSVMLVGFGVCGAYGTFGGLAGMFGPPGEGSGLAPMLIGFGLAGLGIAWLCWLEVFRLWRKRPPGER
jgi:hypothetical protein